MCTHQPKCPPAEDPDRIAAHVVVVHPEQGWSLLCNGVVLFDDSGVLLPDRCALAPRRAEQSGGGYARLFGSRGGPLRRGLGLRGPDGTRWRSAA